MSFNWYKISKIKCIQENCVINDIDRFADIGFNISEKYVKKEFSNTDVKHQYKFIGDRITEGKKRESKIIKKINELTPFILEVSSEEEDIAGIDAHMIGCKGKKSFKPPLRIQIKQRLKGGDDLGLEIIKGWPPDSFDIRKISFNGKDMKTDIDYYFHIDRTGKIKIFNGRAIREIAESMGKSAIIDWGHNIFKGRKHKTSPYGEVVVVYEQGQGGNRTKNNCKVLTYIDINKISSTYEFIV